MRPHPLERGFLGAANGRSLVEVGMAIDDSELLGCMFPTTRGLQ
jgi:hypothetical protein